MHQVGGILKLLEILKGESLPQAWLRIAYNHSKCADAVHKMHHALHLLEKMVPRL